MINKTRLDNESGMEGYMKAISHNNTRKLI